MQDWQTIRRRCLADREPVSRVAHDLRISRTTLQKYLRADSPPRRQGAPTRSPVLEAFAAEIDQLLEETPKITAARILQILRQRHAHLILKERAVRRFVAKRKAFRRPKEVFIRQLYQPGDQTQYDFCDVEAILAGKVRRLHMFSARLSYSTAWFACCYFTQDQSALFDGISQVAREFEGVTKDGVFDNASTAIDEVFSGRRRKVNDAFAAFIGVYATRMHYAAPRKGNEKGGVEGVHGYIVDNFFRPMPSFSSLSELNTALAQFSRDDRERRVFDGKLVIERYAYEQPMLQALPQNPPRPCVMTTGMVNKFAEVRYKTNRYSVPSEHAGKMATIEVFADTLRVLIDHNCVAEHERLFEKNGAVLDPMHYLAVLERKHRSVERAEVLTNMNVPLPLRTLLQRYIEDDRDSAGKRFVRVLQLLKTHRLQDVARAVDAAHQRGVLDPDAIALLLVQGDVQTIEPLPVELLPEKARMLVPSVDLSCYATSLLAEGY